MENVIFNAKFWIDFFNETMWLVQISIIVLVTFSPFFILYFIDAYKSKRKKDAS